MPTTYWQRTNLDANRLDPAFDEGEANELPVNLGPSETYARGEVLAESVDTPGTFLKRDPAATLTGPATHILRYACVTDADGNITYGGAGSVNEFPDTRLDTNAYISGIFKCEDVSGLDADALTELGGRILYGDLTAGIFRF